MTHVGFLTLPDRSMFPRIVGAKGSNVARLRNESGADITVSHEDSTIVIVGMCLDPVDLPASFANVVVAIGSESAIEAAKDAILKMTTSGGGPRRGGRREH